MAGRGGVSAASRITGLARSTIRRGLDELERATGDALSGRVRRPGGGRKKATKVDPTLLSDLKDLVEPATRGDPEAPLLWTSRSLRNLADALRALGHEIGHNVVGDLLRQLNFSLQSNRKTKEGAPTPHPTVGSSLPAIPVLRPSAHMANETHPTGPARSLGV